MTTPSDPQPTPATVESQLRSGCLPSLVFFFILGAFVFAQLVRAALLLGGVTLSNNGSLIITALLVVLPLALLIWRTPPGRARAAYITWLLALFFALFMIPVSWISTADSQLASLLRLLLAALYLGLVTLILRHRQPTLPRARYINTPLALGMGALLSLPWLTLGALGSPLSFVLDLAGGLLLGWLAAHIISRYPLRAIADNPAGYWLDTIAGGFVIALALYFLAVNYAPNGASMLLVIVLPPLAWTALALGRIHKTDEPATANWPALALFIGLAAALPLVTSDPEMLSIEQLLVGRETIFYALVAAGMTFLLSPVLFLLLAASRRWWAEQLSAQPRTFWMGAAALWVTALSASLLLGQPGFHGDRLVVILKEQADVSSAVEMTDYAARRQFVYDTLTTHAGESQQPLRTLLDRFYVDYEPYYLVNALEVEGGLPLRLLLSLHPDVDRVLVSPELRPLPRRNISAAGTAASPESVPWNLEMISAQRVWDELGVRGAGIVVGQSDSGVQGDHPELAENYRGAQIGDRSLDHDYAWFDPWFGDTFPTDDFGHGTHTLATIVGKTVGVAPDATWIACKNLGRGIGNMIYYLDCLQFMLAPYPQAGDAWTDGDPTRSAHVLNNSWGCPSDLEGCDAEALRPAVDALRAAGIFVVASAGNEGPACSTINDPLAIYDSVFSVGAVDRYGKVVGFSSVGPVTVDGSERTKPDIVAPGHEILSAYPHSSYEIASGTSMAGPHVVGVVALLWSANPALIGDIEATEAILANSAAPYQPQTLLAGDPALIEDYLLTLGSGEICRDVTDTSVLPNNVTGFGVVDAFQAVQQALESR